MPPRHFSWRIRGNGLSWFQNPAFAESYDLCIATSMVDLATVKGLNPGFSSIPSLLYFHENQFAYPKSAQVNTAHQIEAQMVQVFGALCCDVAGFNSEYNRTTFLDGLSALLRKLPDGVPKNVVDVVREKSIILPVGVMATHSDRASNGDQALALRKHGDSAPHFIWNHRWEYDKGPDRLLAFLGALPIEFNATFHIVGQSFRSIPEKFQDIHALLKARGWLGQWGFIESTQVYRELLEQADFVLSTSNHDFQGLSVMEAVSRGCVPVLPNRLAYPDFFSSEYLYSGSENIAQEAQSMVAHVLDVSGRWGNKDHDQPALKAPDISAYSLEGIKSQYHAVFERLLA